MASCSCQFLATAGAGRGAREECTAVGWSVRRRRFRRWRRRFPGGPVRARAGPGLDGGGHGAEQITEELPGGLGGRGLLAGRRCRGEQLDGLHRRVQVERASPPNGELRIRLVQPAVDAASQRDVGGGRRTKSIRCRMVTAASISSGSGRQAPIRSAASASASASAAATAGSPPPKGTGGGAQSSSSSVTRLRSLTEAALGRRVTRPIAGKEFIEFHAQPRLWWRSRRRPRPARADRMA